MVICIRLKFTGNHCLFYYSCSFFNEELIQCIRIFFINLEHTHLYITELECDPDDDDEYEDGVFQGLSTLMNFAESAPNLMSQLLNHAMETNSKILINVLLT